MSNNNTNGEEISNGQQEFSKDKSNNNLISMQISDPLNMDKSKIYSNNAKNGIV
jgi:hypothetical protein